MENYLMFNGTKIDLTGEQIAKIKDSFGLKLKKLSEFKAGDTIQIGKFGLIVLEQMDDKSILLLKDFYRESEKLGDDNNYNGSNVDNICNGFADEMAGLVGTDNVVEFTVDLTSDDGLKDYGTVERKAALLTCEQYRKYVYILDKFKLQIYWWLATAYSTPTHNEEDWVKCVSPRGYFNYGICHGSSGVRPFCILKSDIFVSEQED